MIISRTPFRVSFLGGGTDYPSWFRHFGGAVLGTTIDKYSYLLCRHLPPFFDFRYSIVYSKNERKRTIEEIEHPAVRAVLRHLGFERSLHLAHHGDLPARSGTGSSSAFTVGLLHTLYTLQGKAVSKEKLAKEGIYVEQELLKEHVGCQDQIFAAYGGLRHIIFFKDGGFEARPVVISQSRMQELNDHLMLFYTGIRRTAETVTAQYVPDLYKQESHLKSLSDMVQEGVALLTGDRDIRGFGVLLHEAWQMKRSLSSLITNARIDGIYEEARLGGALGGKLLGAGGGGFMLMFAPPECHGRIRERLSRFVYVPFRFESAGSQIVFLDDEEDYAQYDHPERISRLSGFKELEELSHEN